MSSFKAIAIVFCNRQRAKETNSRCCSQKNVASAFLKSFVHGAKMTVLKEDREQHVCATGKASTSFGTCQFTQQPQELKLQTASMWWNNGHQHVSDQAFLAMHATLRPVFQTMLFQRFFKFCS